MCVCVCVCGIYMYYSVTCMYIIQYSRIIHVVTIRTVISIKNK